MSRKTDQERQAEHRLPPCGHEALREFVPGLRKVVQETVLGLRRGETRIDTETLAPEALPDLDSVRLFLEDYALRLHRRQVHAETAMDEADLLGHHLFYMINFDLHHRKLFWVDESLAWMLRQTRLDIRGDLVRLPFPSLAVVFTDRGRLDLGERLLLLDRTCEIRGQRLRILTVYVTRVPTAADEAAGINLSMVFDSQTGSWPYLLGRDLYVRPDDNLEQILDSRFPSVQVSSLDPLFTAAELKRLVHLVLNSILYATSAGVQWNLRTSPIKRAKKSASGRGRKKQRRVAHRVQDMKKAYSAEDVYYLPGRIPISVIRRFREMERSTSGRRLLARFMVRGHWRRANPSWRDKRPRWIEPYWKGPDMAMTIEREYRMKL